MMLLNNIKTPKLIKFGLLLKTMILGSILNERYILFLLKGSKILPNFSRKT
jgi:hypothetical protein